MRRVPRGPVAPVLGLVLLLGATACSSDDPAQETVDIPGSSDSADGGASAEAAGGGGDPAADDGELATSYPEVGLELDLPETEDENQQGALAAYVDYERGMRQLSRTAEPNTLVTDNATDAMLATMQTTVNYLTSNDIRYRGTADIQADWGGSSAEAATLDLCIDGSDLELVRNGTPEPITGPSRLAARVVLTSAGGTWRVAQYDTEEQKQC